MNTLPNTVQKALVYGQPRCAFCTAAVDKLKSLGYLVEYKDISISNKLKTELFSLVPDARSVPQIFINGIHIGGYEHLLDINHDYFKKH